MPTKMSSAASFAGLQARIVLFTSNIDPTADEYKAGSVASLRVDTGKMPTLSAWPAEAASSILFRISVYVSRSFKANGSVLVAWLGS